MTAKLIDGKAFAAGLRERVKVGADALMNSHGTKPGLA
ncbi:MAG: bifunctional methylenetetrahydrofolate dehydrogenase/methenyltetrahydrofolate cyclohydrolase, partial [Alphaproteobacteria bacterium]